MDQRDVEIPSSSLAGPTVGRPSTPQDTTPDPAPSWLISDADRASISGLFSGGYVECCSEIKSRSGIGLLHYNKEMADRSDSIGHWELPWSIPVNAFSSLEIATSQAFPVVNPADMPRGAELCETLDSPKHQGSLTRPAAGVRPSTRVHHNMVPRSPSFLSRGYYSTASDLAGNSLTASRLPDPVSNVQGTSKDPPKSHVCFHFGCSFEGETFKELR